MGLFGVLWLFLRTLANVECSAGLETAREGSHLGCHIILPETGRLMAAHARYWRVAEELGVGDQPRQLQLSISSQDRAVAHKLLDGLPRPIIAIHPGARWETKRWPVEKFAEVARTAIEEQGAGVVLLGSPSEADVTAAVGREIPTSLSGSLRNLAGKTTLKQLAAIGIDGVLIASALHNGRIDPAKIRSFG